MTIKNLHQRRITAARLRDFIDKLTQLEAGDPTDDNKVSHRLAIAQTQGYVAEFEADLAAFDALATANEIAVDGISDVGAALVRARIASGLTHKDLAKRTGLATTAIARYETDDYRSASLDRIAEVAAALDFDLHATFIRSAP